MAVPGHDADGNGNGEVDAADYVVWRKQFGDPYDDTDYERWVENFGASGAGNGGASKSNVPEPTSAILLIVAWVANLSSICFRHNAPLGR